MATRYFAIQPGGELKDVTENIGPAATSAPIAISVDLATNLVTNGSTSRVISKNEVLLALNYLQQYIIAKNWPPA